MLLNDFYKTYDVQAQDAALSCRIEFFPEHVIFGGHFPGQPVVPGVCMMEMVKEVLQQATGSQLLLQHAGNVKFLQLITPEMRPAMHLSWKKSDNGYSVIASFKTDSTFLFKLDGTYTLCN